MSSKVLRTARNPKKLPDPVKKAKQDPEYEELIETIATIERACGRLRELVIGTRLTMAVERAKKR